MKSGSHTSDSDTPTILPPASAMDHHAGSKLELSIDRTEIIRICVQEGVPIYQGKIDKTLFQAQLQALGALPQSH